MCLRRVGRHVLRRSCRKGEGEGEGVGECVAELMVARARSQICGIELSTHGERSPGDEAIFRKK